MDDVIAYGLDILFVGINPSTFSAKVGHHFARNTNRFYRALYEGGLTPRLYAPEEDAALVDVGIGITNIAVRATGQAQELKAADYLEGRAPLRGKVELYAPMIVAFAGRMAARGYFGDARPVGELPDMIGPSRVFVVPSPSAANKAHHPDADLFNWYARLREFRDRLKGNQESPD